MDHLARLSMGNRALIALITVFVMIYGVIATGQLKQELIPSVQFPQVYIIASYQGASPQVVEDKVTIPIEQAVLSVQNLESSQSTSSTGQSVVIATMKYGTNMSAVQQDVQAAISRIKGVLPEQVDTQVITGSFDTIPILVYSVSDETNSVQLAQRLRDTVVPKLERLDGVRSVEVTGAPPAQVQVSLDHAKLSAAKLTAADVITALTGSGNLVAAGELTDGDQTMSVTLGQRFTDLEQVSAVRVVPTQPTPGAKPVTLGEIAKVRQTTDTQRSISRTNGKPSVTLAITKVPDANTVAVSDAVKAELPALTEEIGHGAAFVEAFDQAPFITQSIHDLLVEGGMGLVMAIVVILLFLWSLRSTLVTAVSIPVSVLATMIGLQLAGYSLNILTLGAVTIAIGRVVDDSIVVIENIKRHLSYGVPKIEAILTGVREVAVAITAATITTVAVFLPIGLVGGQTGELFRPFALTVGLALMSSLVVALTIVPVLAYWFLSSPSGEVDAEQVRFEAEAAEHRSWLQRAYVPTVRWSLRHPAITLLLSLALLVGSVAMVPLLKTNFLGDAGQNTMTVTQKFPAALSLAEQDARATRLEQALQGVEGIQTVQLTVGSDGFNFGLGGTADAATFNLTLAPDADKAAVEQRVREAAKPLEDTGLITVSSAAAMGGGSSVEVIVKGPDRQRLTKAAADVTAAMKQVPGAADVQNSLASDRPQISVVPTPAASQYGLSDQAIQQQVRMALSTTPLGRFETAAGSSMDVVLMPQQRPEDLTALRQLVIMSPTGPVPLARIAKVQKVTVPTQVSHADGQRSVTVTLTPTSDDLGSFTSEVQSKLSGVDLPEGVTATLGGASQEQSDAFRQLGLALLVAIAIVYVVMVATFKSLVQPLILAVSIPFAATGAIAGLLVTDTPLGVPSLIGVLMLVGIVVTNAIVLIDLVNHYRERGDSVDDALIDGSRQRLRPILMTAVATIFALVPMALGLSGKGMFISKPLAIVVIGGLLSSTLLTLIIVPVLYHLVEGRQERRAARREARKAAVVPASTPDPVTTAEHAEVQTEAAPPVVDSEPEVEPDTEDAEPVASEDDDPARPARGLDSADDVPVRPRRGFSADDATDL